MMQWTLISAAILVVSNAVADVLVQPGYGQPRLQLQQQQLGPMQPMGIHQRTSEIQHQPIDHGYHVELHPVYGNLHQPDNGLSYSPMQPQMTYSPKAYKRLLGSQFSGRGFEGISGAIPAQYVPLAVHSRLRRSVTDESSPGSNTEKRTKVGVATKSTLNENVPPVVDLQSQNGEVTKNLDDKRVDVRHSQQNQGSTLFGLNPSNLHPGYHQYTEPFNPRYQIINEQTQPQVSPQVNSRATSQEQTQNLVTPPSQQIYPNTNRGDYKNSMSVQRLDAQQQQQSGLTQNIVANQQRNFPDPRPPSAPLRSPRPETPNGPTEPRTPDTTQAMYNADDELVGSHHHHHKTKIITSHLGRYRGAYTAPNVATSGGYRCSCSNPGYVAPNVDDALASYNLATGAQVYQLPSLQETTYPPVRFVVLPPSYNNYVSNYDWGYQPSLSPYNACLQDTVPSVAYQLV
ncbi:uncharacterized protein LOC128885025 [Hylaeus volcanicus]|uniref:uncharacterized protein LOC128885025 n=1 Tax=Hylaeus volcanicus TaxID=313075 RepID=UPI0023B789DA|nr:uncharacterized protein LOC128885025 [Hylaeus volcanicus]